MIKYVLIIVFLISCKEYLAQNRDFVVTINGDTVKMTGEGSVDVGPHSLKVRDKGRRLKLKADQVSVVYSAGLYFDPVYPAGRRKKRWSFMIRQFSGDVAVYRYRATSSDSRGNTNVHESFYFRQKNQSRGEVWP